MLGPVVARGQGDLDQGAEQPAGGRDIAGEIIITTQLHTHTAGGDIITPFISFILRLNIAPLLWYLLSGCRSSRSLPLINYSDVLFTVHTRAGNEPSQRFTVPGEDLY